MKKQVFHFPEFILKALISFLVFMSCNTQEYITSEEEPLHILAQQFSNPPIKYRPYVWWHWMGSNFSKTGITKDLEAMKEAGIQGATIFNLASAVQETHTPMDNNPWPWQTYRSEAYWEAMRHAASEAKRLGLKLGIQSTPGYSTTGGPWITEERGMQRVVSSQTATTGNGKVQSLTLPTPEIPLYEGWGSTFKQATYYKDIAVLAIPEKIDTPDQVIDLTAFLDKNGNLEWVVPEGKWTICRIGHAPTMSNPHPLPDDLIGHALEADKMSREQSIYHWKNVLEPLKEHLGEYIGDSFTHILTDSYEADAQNWTPSFREDFLHIKGYDPLPWIAISECKKDIQRIKEFEADYQEVISRLFIDNGWKIAREMINEAGLLFFWEPYEGPFDTYESVSIPDIPMGEFWTHKSGAIRSSIAQAGRFYNKKIIGAEAFTGRPEISQYTESPAFLKRSADGSFISGANLLFLHHWVHQPFDDHYQPGMGMGWWGTHFGRHQTWIKPGKAFFTYLSRCQMLLQQGEYASATKNILRRSTPEAEIFFITNPSSSPLTQQFSFPVSGCSPELWDPYKGTIRNIPGWKEQDGMTYIELTFQPDESQFIIFPTQKNSLYAHLKSPYLQTVSEQRQLVNGSWLVHFNPKLDTPFTREFTELTDLRLNEENTLKYFAGTAEYEKTIHIDNNSLEENNQIMLILGELYDIASVTINQKEAGVLWHPPYEIDITSYVKAGDNNIKIAVTNNWANLLIGDEQYEADFEWGKDRGETMGRAMKQYPEWFLSNTPRPSERKAFSIWYYHRKDSPLQPAGLIGPVQVIQRKVERFD